MRTRFSSAARAVGLAGWPAVGLLAVGFLGCGEATGSQGADDGVFVGGIDGTDSLVAVSAAGADVVVYVCGGPSTLATHTRWYRGTRNGEAADLTAEDGATGSLTLSDDGVSGTLTHADGVTITFDATRAVEGSATSLFSKVDSGCRTGVIVKQDSLESDPVVQGVWCSSEAQNQSDIFEQVTPITPPEAGLTKLDVQVDAIDKQLTVDLVDPAAF